MTIITIEIPPPFNKYHYYNITCMIFSCIKISTFLSKWAMPSRHATLQTQMHKVKGHHSTSQFWNLKTLASFVNVWLVFWQYFLDMFWLKYQFQCAELPIILKLLFPGWQHDSVSLNSKKVNGSFSWLHGLMYFIGTSLNFQRSYHISCCVHMLHIFLVRQWARSTRSRPQGPVSSVFFIIQVEASIREGSQFLYQKSVLHVIM